jgi:hypothetical protein
VEYPLTLHTYYNLLKVNKESTIDGITVIGTAIQSLNFSINQINISVTITEINNRKIKSVQ